MQIELGAAIIIAVQVGTTTALGMLMRLVIKRLDQLNGRVHEHERELSEHIKEYHSKKSD